MKIKAVFLSLFIIFFITGISFAGSYAPAAGQEGSTAIHMDDLLFVGWATGWENYLVGSNASAAWQMPEKALGKAVGNSYDIVSLGRGGEITLTFDSSIGNGDGYDFAVFENSFSNTFLELAFVEVSSNGLDFFRFDNDSLTANPVGGFGNVDPTNIDGFAGKYKQGFGTQFDLEDLAYNDLLDINNIGYIKLLDIVGDGSYFDTSGDVIYEPYPTSGSAGFDLDAVGVINQGSPVPVPAAIWLLGSGLVGLAGLGRKSN